MKVMLARPVAVVSLMLVLAATLAGLSISGLWPQEAAVGARGAGRPVSPGVRLASFEDPVGYWTDARMARARPMAAPRPGRRARETGLSRQAGRDPRSVAGVSLTDAREGYVVQAALQPAAYEYPFPFSRRSLEGPLYRVAPYRTVGKIFFTRGGFDYACSGASVVSSPRHVVFTAGHCLFDPETQEWSGNVLFVPAKNGKSEPYGRFGAQRVDGIEQLWVLTGWADLGELTYDMGAFSVRRNAKGRTLQQSVGALGFAYDQPRSQHWDLFGYPAVDPFGGRRMVVCEASHAVDDLSDDVGTGPDPMGVGCDMTPGSSGGPWIKDLRRGSFLNGVNSYLYAAEPAAMYSPYFGEAAQVLRCAAATGVPTTAC